MKLYKYSSVPKIEEVAEGVYKTSIPQPFYDDNNIYIIKSDEPTMIDSGYIRNLGLLQRALKKIDLSFSKLKHIFYTHNHLDHITGALTLRNYTKAILYGMKGMSTSIGDYISYMRNFQRGEVRLMYKAIQDAELRRKYVQLASSHWDNLHSAYKKSKKVDPNLKMDIELVEGDVIDIGNRLIGFLHTPGHNNWHLTPYLVGEGIYFTGDLVLKNISSIYAEMDGNLADYLNSLERLMQIPIKRILPAHGEEPEQAFKSIKALHKTLMILERGVVRRLKSDVFDLKELATEAMGDKIKDSPYYVVALGIIHAIVLKQIKSGFVKILEVDPPYEKYKWIGEVD